MEEQLFSRPIAEGGGLFSLELNNRAIRRLTLFGEGPKFSPDGSHVVFWNGTSNVTPFTPGSSRIHVLDVHAGSVRQLAPEFAFASHPIWTPDGQHVLFVGQQRESESALSDDVRLDWWVAPLSGAAPIRTGVFSILAAKVLDPKRRSPPVPSGWTGNDVLFSSRSGESVNIWRIALSANTWKPNAMPRQVTFGTGQEVDASGDRSGRITFVSFHRTAEIYRFPLNSSESDSGERLTHNLVYDNYLSLNRRGTLLAFASLRSGQWEVWIRDLTLRRETLLVQLGAEFDAAMPFISPEGERVAFLKRHSRRFELHVADTVTGQAAKLCDDCGAPIGWRRGSHQVIYHGGMYTQKPFIAAVNVRDRSRLVLARHPRYGLIPRSVSPDGEWLLFDVVTEPNAPVLKMARIATVGDEASWTTLQAHTSYYPTWDPSGQRVYYVATHDGFPCLWGQDVDFRGKLSLSDRIIVRHFHSGLRPVRAVIPNLAVGERHLFMTMEETTSSLWLAAPR